MKAALFSSYFPCIQYVSKFLIYDKIIIDVYENYLRQTYRNRCKIHAANGISNLSIPVNKSFRTYIKEIEIDYSEDWQKNHYRAILSAYKNSAFYDYYFDEFSNIFDKKERFLIDLNEKILQIIFKTLKISPAYVYSSEFVKPNDSITDFREIIHPKNHNLGFDKEFTPKQYMQVFGNRHGFTPNMSIIDLIFNEGPLATSIIRESIHI